MFNKKLKKQLQELIQSNNQLKEERRRVFDSNVGLTEENNTLIKDIKRLEESLDFQKTKAREARDSHVVNLALLNEEIAKLTKKNRFLLGENRGLKEELNRCVKRDPKTGRYTKKNPESQKA